jgi:hypothetical protein
LLKGRRRNNVATDFSKKIMTKIQIKKCFVIVLIIERIMRQKKKERPKTGVISQCFALGTPYK